MKVSSLTKEETINLLNLYRELEKVEKELNDYIDNTAAPEVNNIKSARDKREQSNEEATKILNSDFQTKDPVKMINLLEEYLESSNEISESNEKSEKIMDVICRLNDKIKDIENEIKKIENKEIREIKYDSIDIISDLKCRLINCDREFNNIIIENFRNKYNYSLVPNKNNLADELIKIVEDHISEKTKEEEEKFKIISNTIKPEIEEQPKQEEIVQENNQDNSVVVPYPTNEDVVEQTSALPVDTQMNEENIDNVPLSNEINNDATVFTTPVDNSVVVPYPTNEDVVEQTSALPIDTQMNEDNNLIIPAVDEPVIESNPTIDQNNGFKPISDIITSSDVSIQQTPINNNVLYVDINNANSKLIRIPENKKEIVSNNWLKRKFDKPIIKSITDENTKEEISNDVVMNNFNLENFVNNKAA